MTLRCPSGIENAGAYCRSMPPEELGESQGRRREFLFRSRRNRIEKRLPCAGIEEECQALRQTQKPLELVAAQPVPPGRRRAPLDEDVRAAPAAGIHGDRAAEVAAGDQVEVGRESPSREGLLGKLLPPPCLRLC